ncbi:hypothetical protein ACA910_012837 [Epithemia clementina (nom. ined.)]
MFNGNEEGYGRRPLRYSSSETEPWKISRRNVLVAQQQEQVLNQIGALLEQADQSIDELDDQEGKHGLLSAAIVRGCQDLATTVGQLANQLEEQTGEERIALAQACILEIDEHEQANGGHDNAKRNDQLSTTTLALQSAQELVANQSSNYEMLRVLDAATNFLRDVEASLRLIDQSTAEELADVSLTVARLFVASMQSVYAQIAANENVSSRRRHWKRNQQQHATTVEIEILEDDDDDDDDAATNDEGGHRGMDRSKKQRTKNRVRVLWPPIGPCVANCLQWTQSEAMKRPILAVALGITLWPMTILPVVLGAPLVLMDGFVQDLYNHFDDTPLVVGLERGAAHVYHTGRLALISLKLAGRQTMYIVHKQLDRQGGAGQLAQNCVHLVVDRVTHPIETIQGAWGGLCWSADRIRTIVEDLLQKQEGQQTALQELQV